MNPYVFRVAGLRVVDGDTVDCDIDLGMDTWIHAERVRLSGIDAPETRTKDLQEKERGIKAREWLKAMLDVELHQLRLVTDEFEPVGKFGRVLGTFFIEDAPGHWINVNQTMIEEDLARPYFGGKR